ncbi:MAG: sigma-70 family RNA polymerase sigma factor [Lachnospiraceae bacterium]|nr:sigma-70 family RNA polymerase sigma factor [Lachnospiraceae bacterium]
MQSMEEIYQEYARLVYRYLLSMTKDEDLAEELTQETFFQAIRSIGRYDESCKISTWLCAIAKNVWYGYLRKHPVTENLDDQVIAVDSAEKKVLAEEERMMLLKKVHELPEPYREVIYLRIYAGLSFREIGSVIGKTENFARVTFYRGKERLKKTLSKENENE